MTVPDPVFPRRGRPPRFSRDRIVETALELLPELGLDGLSMRRLAEALGTTPATLYRHVDGQDDLVAAVADAVISTIEVLPPPADDEIAEWLTAAVRSYRTILLQHPGVAEHLLLHGPTGPHGLEGMARICEVLARTGRSPEEVAWAYDWLMTTATTYTMKEARLDLTGGAELVAKSLNDRAGRHDDTHLLSVLAAFTGDMEAAFERNTQEVIRAIVDGQRGS
ncbi:MAG: TetR family transcriptional regulator [Actinomycetota bacterium]